MSTDIPAPGLTPTATPSLTAVPTAPIDYESAYLELRAIASCLWPYVRYFGLCGACQEAVSAVADLAQHLGEDDQVNAVVQSAANKTQAATIDAVANWLMDHRFNGIKWNRSSMEIVVRELQQLKK